ncbi:hypothetical protein Patl1_03605 [Pistacia atlantica]|uniref:Uncharacterized protein n=1 Tax=Pistacia atlantica TaxID=434234 RepID=A0ACC1CCU8_9ROSI|nr:hypothetical protein Patl1_03605 [Pistacia atlantica]
MVGIFSRFSVGRTGHRRTQSALDEREVLPPTPDVASAATSTTTATHGIEVAVEFKPVEHPIEPMDNDQPIQCPLPEPSILNVTFATEETPISPASLTAAGAVIITLLLTEEYGRNESQQGMRRRSDLPVMKEGGVLESEDVETKPRPMQSNRLILPSLSAPEHNLLHLLEESGI